MNIKFWNSCFETHFLSYFKIICFKLSLTIDGKGLNSTIVEFDAVICSMFTLRFWSKEMEINGSKAKHKM